MNCNFYQSIFSAVFFNKNITTHIIQNSL